jgi:hypothetical protein
MKGLKRIQHAPFSNINLQKQGDVVRFSFISEYAVHKMVKDKITKRFTENVTRHKMQSHYELAMPGSKSPEYSLLSKLSTYLSTWDK